MVKIENRCCDCASPGYPCRGSICPLRRVEVFYCDRCDEEIDPYKVFHEDGEDLCKDCYSEDDE